MTYIFNVDETAHRKHRIGLKYCDNRLSPKKTFVKLLPPCLKTLWLAN